MYSCLVYYDYYLQHVRWFVAIANYRLIENRLKLERYYPLLSSMTSLLH